MSINTLRLSIAAGLSIQDRAMTADFIAMAKPQWLEAWPFSVQELVTEDGLSGSTYDVVGDFNAASERVHAQLSHAPRGTWARLTQRLACGDVFHDLIMADGLGFATVVSSHLAPPRRSRRWRRSSKRRSRSPVISTVRWSRPTNRPPC